MHNPPQPKFFNVLFTLWLALTYALTLQGAPAPQPAIERFSFVALGCMPYGQANFAAYERLLLEINRHSPAFTVHCGDLQGSGERPSDAFLAKARAWFDTLNHPVVYTPGDNEWTDVHRHGENPGEWLAKLRAQFFAEERSFGRRPMPLVTQRRMPDFAKYVENARWSRDGVVFATVHVVGSNNNLQPAIPGADEEFRERDAANEAWIRAIFAEAAASEAKGVVLFFQAQPFFGTGFKLFRATVEVEARAFTKPVLLVHADGHRYLNERGMRFAPDSKPLANVSRLETFGAGDIHAVLVVVDPGSPQVFLGGPLLVPDNALPVLPRKK